MNISIIGPKLEAYDHKTEEKCFLDDKKKATSFVFDEKCENDKNDLRILRLSPLNTYDNYLKTSSQLKSNEPITPISPNSPSKMLNNKKSATNLFKILKKAKQFVGKVRNSLYYKNFQNMSNFQKSILNDMTVFKEGKSIFSFNVLIFRFFNCIYFIIF